MTKYVLIGKPGIRWSGPAIMAESDARDYGVRPGSLVVWAGESDGAGHVDEDATRILEEHDATGSPGDYAIDWGPETQSWLDNALNEMSEELGLKAGYLH